MVGVGLSRVVGVGVGVRVEVGAGLGDSAWPSVFQPQQATEPSSLNPQVWD